MQTYSFPSSKKKSKMKGRQATYNVLCKLLHSIFHFLTITLGNFENVLHSATLAMCVVVFMLQPCVFFSIIRSFLPLHIRLTYFSLLLNISTEGIDAPNVPKKKKKVSSFVVFQFGHAQIVYLLNRTALGKCKLVCRPHNFTPSLMRPARDGNQLSQ